MKTILKIVAVIAFVWYGIPFILGLLGTVFIGAISVKTTNSQQDSTNLRYEREIRKEHDKEDSIRESKMNYDSIGKKNSIKDSSTSLIKRRVDN